MRSVLTLISRMFLLLTVYLLVYLEHFRAPTTNTYSSPVMKLVSSNLPWVLQRLSSMSTTSSKTLSELPTELLVQVFACLQVADLFSVQHTCRTFFHVVSDSAFLQYAIHTKINVLEDLLPPDVSLHDRVALLKHHEAAWNDLELNMVTQLVHGEEISARRLSHILQDGYLIYKAICHETATIRYGYMDLYISDQPNAEARWEHISLGAIHPLSDIIFAVDQDLVVAIRF